MSTPQTEAIPTVDRGLHATFFRQSGWLILATIVGGAMTLGVHPLNKHIPDSEYTAFGVLLMVVSWDSLPCLAYEMRLYADTSWWLGYKCRKDIHHHSALRLFDGEPEAEVLWTPWQRVEVFNGF